MLLLGFVDSNCQSTHRKIQRSMSWHRLAPVTRDDFDSSQPLLRITSASSKHVQRSKDEDPRCCCHIQPARFPTAPGILDALGPGAQMSLTRLSPQF